MINNVLSIKRNTYISSNYGIIIRHDAKNKKIYIQDMHDEFANQECVLKAVSYELGKEIKQRFKINLDDYNIIIKKATFYK